VAEGSSSMDDAGEQRLRRRQPRSSRRCSPTPGVSRRGPAGPARRLLVPNQVPPLRSSRRGVAPALPSQGTPARLGWSQHADRGLGQTIEFTVDGRMTLAAQRRDQPPRRAAEHLRQPPGQAGRFSVNGEPVTTGPHPALRPEDVRLSNFRAAAAAGRRTEGDRTMKRQPC
jgi:hypothetical protein